MAENLRSSKYNNGDTILYLKINPAVDKDVYGVLYNFYVVDDERNLCLLAGTCQMRMNGLPC